MTKLLDKIDSPADVKGLTPHELEQLAAEIRELLVGTVTDTGGHLASNLGVVELTIALHRVFDSPEDKIIWDVGHQSYVHKLLTGRRKRFNTLRQSGGLSGFTCRSESEHDPFGAGHAGTSVSAALGMALARDLSGERNHIIAVTGDGALTAGMVFEAVNHAGHLGTKLIVVLNDNGMAISPNTGAVSRMLNQVRFDPMYEFAKRGAREAVTHLPFGELAWAMSKHIKDRFGRALLPSALWEELGFIYLGPVDGHDIKEVELALMRARDFETTPTLVHVLTTKGKGYAEAEADAVRFHGVPSRGTKEGKDLTYSKVFGNTVVRLMRENKRVVAISAAMLEGTGLTAAAGEFPGRVFDVGICEQHAVTLAAGMATQGLIPIVAIYSTFLQRAYGQVIHDVCIQNLPVVFAIDRAGIVGDDGVTHQGTFDISYLSTIPNLVVAAPKDENELQHLLFTAVGAGCPMAIRYPRGSGIGIQIDTELQSIPTGKSELLRRGGDVAILAIGTTVAPAIEAARELACNDIECSVVNARFAKPLDAELITELAGCTKHIVTIEENVLSGGFGSSVVSLLQKSGLHDVQIKNIGIPDEFVEQGAQDALHRKYGLDAEGIVHQVLALFPGCSPGDSLTFKGKGVATRD